MAARRQRFRLYPRELPAELLFDQSEEFLHAEPIEHVFEPRLETIGAVAVIDEHAHHGVGDLVGLGRSDHDAGLATKILVTGDPAEQQAKPDASLDAEAVFDRHRLEADVVGVLQHRDDAAAVEADIELARDAVKRALVENVEVPFARIGPGVEELLRIDARGRRPGDVTDIVGTRAARAEAEIEDGLDHVDGVRRRNLPDLQIGARGDMGIAAAIVLGEVGQPGELPVVEDTVGDPQPAHIGGLIGSRVEQPEKTPAEIVIGLRRLVAGSLGLEALAVAVQRMKLALELLLIGQLLSFRQQAVLGFDVIGVGADRLGSDLGRWRARSTPGREVMRSAPDVEAGSETFEVALLLVVEVGAGRDVRHRMLHLPARHSAGTLIGAVSGIGCSAGAGL